MSKLVVQALPGDILTRHAEIHTTVLSARGVVQFWSGQLDEAAAILDAGAAAATLSGSVSERADCHGYLALLEALRGQLNRAAELAAEASQAGQDGTEIAGPACGSAEVALALVHLERNERHDARDRLKRADAALRVRPDRLVGAAACLVVARYRLAEGRAKAASEMIARARHGWSPPGWLDHTLTLLESRAYAATGDLSSAVGIANRPTQELVSMRPWRWRTRGWMPATIRPLDRRWRMARTTSRRRRIAVDWITGW